MGTLLNALHVLGAVLVIGPLLVAPFAARRAIRQGSADGVRQAANQLLLFGAGSVLVVALGVGTVLAGDEWELATPWVLISSTLYVVALGLIGFYAVPALRKAAQLVAAPGPAPAPEPVSSPDADPAADPAAEPPSGEAATGTGLTTTDLRSVARLHAIGARISGAGWLLLATFAAITVLMTVRPFD